MVDNILESMDPKLEQTPADLALQSMEKKEISIESPKSPEQTAKKSAEQAGENITVEKASLEMAGLGQVASPQLPNLSPQTALYKNVESILAEDLGGVYQTMSAKEKAEFKKTGEETASAITKFLQSAKIKIHSIFHLILKWLSLIPKLNRFYLEQEAKIKTDKILALKKRMQSGQEKNK